MSDRANTITLRLPPQRRLVLLVGAGVVTLVLSFSLAVSVGAVFVPDTTVWGGVFNAVVPGAVEPVWPLYHAAIVWDLRLPRAVLATFVGAGLAVTGAALQAVTRNPLAVPHLMGISSGAAFRAILALLHTGLFLGLATVPLMAFLGAMVAIFLVPKGDAGRACHLGGPDGAGGRGDVVHRDGAGQWVDLSGRSARHPYGGVLDVGRAWPCAMVASDLATYGNGTDRPVAVAAVRRSECNDRGR